MVATRSRTPVAITSQAGNQFMKAYRIMTPVWARGEGEEEEKRKKRRGEGGDGREREKRREGDKDSTNEGHKGQ